MAPKKKGGKKQADDWENDLGEAPDPIAAATEEAKATDDAEHEGGQNGEVNGGDLEGGGLLAALKKNKAKRAKKGKPVEDFVEGEDPTATETPAEIDLSAKAPEEATLDDDEVFAAPTKKGKGGKKQPEKPASVDADSDKDDDGGVKSKKEKEKEKKEREKQRKKEQVRFQFAIFGHTYADSIPQRPRRRRLQLQFPAPKMSRRRLYRKPKLKHMLLQRPEGRRKRFLHTLQPFKSSKNFYRNSEKSRLELKPRRKLLRKSD